MIKRQLVRSEYPAQDEVGKTADHVNQVDEVHAHSDGANAGNLDNADNVNAGQVNNVNDASKQTPNIKDHDGVQDKQNIMERMDEIAPRSDNIMTLSKKRLRVVIF